MKNETTEIVYIDFQAKKKKGSVLVNNKEETLTIEGEETWVNEMIAQNSSDEEVAS